MFRKSLFLGVTVVLSASIVAAQGDSCPPLIQTAIEQVGDSCGTLDRNTACYGNISLKAEARPNVSDFAFADVGDIVSLTDLQTLETSPLDEENNTWGVAVLSVQANLPDTLPGQNVTMMVYGDSTLTPQIPVTVTVSANEVINIRQQPNTSAAIVGEIRSSTTLKGDGRLEDSSWIRVSTEEGVVGWVSASVASIEGDIESLPVRTPDDVSAPAQSAFYFTSGIGQSACADLPSGGLVLQSPNGTEVELIINDVNIEIGSTVAIRFLDKVPGATEADPELPHLAFYVLEGGIKKVGLTQDPTRPVRLPTVEQGLVLYVPVDEATGLPNGQAPLMKPYDGEDIKSLTPLLTALPDPITPAEPMSEEAFTDLQTVDLQEGTWTFAPSAAPVTCLDNDAPQSVAALLPLVANAVSGTIAILPAGETVNGADNTGATTSVTAAETGDVIVLTAGGLPNPIPMSRTELNVYTGFSGIDDISLLVTTPTTGVLRVVTPITTPGGEVTCARAEIFVTGSTGE